MEVYLRYCPDCGEEYQPHMTRCIECGGVLQDMPEGGGEPAAPPRAFEPSLPPGDYLKLVDGLSAATVERLVRLFVGASLPVKVESLGYRLCLSARLEDRSAVLAILEREGVLPSQTDAAAPPIGADGGPCPACGTTIAPGSVECPECGLALGGGGCESCGAELAASDTVCRGCGRPLD